MSKAILVTGAASGLGNAILLALGEAYREGRIDVHPVAFDIKDGDDVVSPLSNPSSIDTLERYDYVGLINCAGINSNNWFSDISAETLMKVMQVNAFSFVYMTQALLDKLTDNSGFVLNIVSNAADMPMTSSLAYNASKAAAKMITRQMAHELTKSHGITVFSISPNKLSGTEMSKQIEAAVVETRGWTPEYAAEYQKKSLMHGLETPPDAIANYIVHLIESGNWKFMSGTDIPFGK